MTYCASFHMSCARILITEIVTLHCRFCMMILFKIQSKFYLFIYFYILRASILKNATLSYFIISKSYFINYTIPFYNTPYIQKLYYFTFSLKYFLLIFFYYFFHIITFFQLRSGIKNIYIYIYIYIFSIVLQYNSKFRIILQHYCKKFCNSKVYHFLMQMFFNYEMPKKPQIWHYHSSMLVL